MYMYYLLGYRLFEEYQGTKPKCSTPTDETISNSDNSVVMESREQKKAQKAKKVNFDRNSPLKRAQETFGYFAKSEILNSMDEKVIAKV